MASSVSPSSFIVIWIIPQSSRPITQPTGLSFDSLTATGTSLLPGNVHQLSIQRMDGNVLGIEKPTTHHNFPCSTHRRLGDLGNVVVRATASTTSGSEATYAARFGLFDDQLHTLVGNKCVLWSNADVTCDIYKNGCGTESDNRVILASGIIGLTNGDSNGGNEGKEYDYDCTSKIVRSVSARIYPGMFKIVQNCSKLKNEILVNCVTIIDCNYSFL